MHFVTHYNAEIFGIPENVPRFLKNVCHIPNERQLELASLESEPSLMFKWLLHILIFAAK